MNNELEDVRNQKVFCISIKDSQVEFEILLSY